MHLHQTSSATRGTRARKLDGAPHAGEEAHRASMFLGGGALSSAWMCRRHRSDARERRPSNWERERREEVQMVQRRQDRIEIKVRWSCVRDGGSREMEDRGRLFSVSKPVPVALCVSGCGLWAFFVWDGDGIEWVDCGLSKKIDTRLFLQNVSSDTYFGPEGVLITPSLCNNATP
jgi:hypothetical protein